MPLTLNNRSYNAFVKVFGEELRQEGRQEGHQEGHQKGHQEGHQKGRQVGKLEERICSAFYTTIKCAKKGFPFETILELVAADFQTVYLFLNKFNELGDNVFQWFENEYMPEFQKTILVE